MAPGFIVRGRRGAGVLVMTLLLGTVVRAMAASGLTVSPDGNLLLQGRPVRAAGVNYYDVFVRTLSSPSRPHPDEGFRELSRRGIPFLRFSAGGYWPVEWGLYRTNRDSYFQRLDTLVRSAESHHLGLIPSLFWNLATIPDVVGEPVGSWGDPSSRTVEFMREYTRLVVGRYRGSPAIWGWEFGNEYNLPADLPNAAEHRPPIVPSLGTPAGRGASDDLTHAQFRSALAEFAREVRRWDPDRAVFSGNAFPRGSAWHQMREHRWERDSPEQWETMLAADNPDPINTLSGRLYTPEDATRIRTAVNLGVRLRKPLFVGEFGVPAGPADPMMSRFREQVALLDASGVRLAALWVYDFDGQAADWSVTSANDRGAMLNAVAELNSRWRTNAVPRRDR
ncbi:MAG: hypothetical protein JNL10_00495 [Verrucomicrobiales bacterium]|nr:hypothetical protein [Verrucomicrobiales bacterium]